MNSKITKKMEKNSIMNNSSISKVKNQIWGLLDILRGSLGVNDHHVVLLFLSMYKDNQLSKEFIFNRNKIAHGKSGAFLKDEFDVQKNDYSKIIEAFQSSFSLFKIRNNEDEFEALIEALFQIDREILSENFPLLFDSALYRIVHAQGRIGGEGIQPQELSRFICSLVDLPKNAKIFNPFAGLASFGVFFDQEISFHGQEINQKSWAIGALRLMAHGKMPKSNFKCQDSILAWPEDETFDLIVSNPPYGMRISNNYKEVVPDHRRIEPFFIEKGIGSLSADGKLVALLPMGFLSNGSLKEKNLRNQLVAEDLIDTIISLPGGLLQNTGIPLVILIIDKNKKAPGRVRFVEGQNFVDTLNSREKILNNEGLLTLIQSGYQDSDKIRIVDNRRIKDNEYNLSVPRYFQKEIEGTKLKDILRVVRGSRRTDPEEIKFVRIRDLQEDKLNFNLDVSNLQDSTPNRPQLRIIEESCLLIAARWRTLKPTYFEYSGSPICVSNDILSFDIKDELADAAYLINELHSDYVEEQLASYRQGTTIPMIRRDDFLEIVIKLPSIEEQRAKVSGLREISEKIQQLQTERNALAHGVKLKEFNEFASLKHTLGRPRQNILGWSKNLSNFFDRKSISNTSLNQDFKELFDMGIMEAIQEINRDIKFISEVLEKGENGLVLEDYEKEIIPLDQVNLIFKNLSHNGFKFSIEKDLLEEEDMKTRGVLINKVLLQTLLDNLLTNADKYGFKEKDKGNRVSIELADIDNNLIIEVKNNGLPFPKNFNREKFIMKYSTADTTFGSGLGGYDINRIATYFENENWELDLNSDPLYPVIFRFSLPIKLLK